MKIATTLISTLLVSLTVQAQPGGSKTSEAFKAKPTAAAAADPKKEDAKKSGKEEASDVVFKCQVGAANPLKQDPKNPKSALVYGTQTLEITAVSQQKSAEVKAAGLTVKLNAVSDEKGEVGAALWLVEKDVMVTLAPNAEGYLSGQIIANTQDKEKTVLAFGACGLTKK